MAINALTRQANNRKGLTMKIKDSDVIEIVTSNFVAAKSDIDSPEYNDPDFPEWTSFTAYRDNVVDTVLERGGTQAQVEMALNEYYRMVENGS